MGLNALTRDKAGEASELATEVRENLQEILNQDDNKNNNIMHLKSC